METLTVAKMADALGVRHVLISGDVFEIFNPIVLLVSIPMVYFHSWRARTDEKLCNNSVDIAIH